MSRIEDGGAVEAGLRAAISEIQQLQGDLASCRLRRDAWKQGFDERSALVAVQAAEITRLRAENAAMREALTDIVEDRGVCSKCGRLAEMPSNCVSCDDDRRCTWSPRSPASAARAALSKASQAEGGAG